MDMRLAYLILIKLLEQILKERPLLSEEEEGLFRRKTS
jgi:hypothetical protein